MYSFLLALAILCVLVALTASICANVWSRRLVAGARKALRWLTVRAGGLAILLAVTAALIHLAFGHRPNTPQALDFAEFLLQHPTVAVIPLLTIVALVLAALIATDQE